MHTYTQIRGAIISCIGILQLHTSKQSYTHTYIHIHTYTYINAYMHTSIHTDSWSNHIGTYRASASGSFTLESVKHTHIHTHTYIYIHTYIQIRGAIISVHQHLAASHLKVFGLYLMPKLFTPKQQAVCMHVCMHACMCVRVCVCVYVCMYIYIYIYIHTYIHIYLFMCVYYIQSVCISCQSCSLLSNRRYVCM